MRSTPDPVESVGDRGGRGLVDDGQHVEAGDGPGFGGGTSLSAVKVRRHGDHGVFYFAAEQLFGIFLKLAKDEGRDLLGRVRFDQRSRA